MINKSDVSYELEEMENTSFEHILQLHRDDVVIVATGSGANGIGHKASYKIGMFYQERNRFYCRQLNDESAQKAMIIGVIDCIKDIPDGVRVCVVSSTHLGFEGAMKGKGTNCELNQQCLIGFKEKKCTFTEIRCKGMCDDLNKAVIKLSGNKKLENNYVPKKQRKEHYVGEYKKQVIEECLNSVIEALLEENVDERIIERIRGMKP